MLALNQEALQRLREIATDDIHTWFYEISVGDGLGQVLLSRGLIKLSLPCFQCELLDLPPQLSPIHPIITDLGKVALLIGHLRCG